MYSIHFNAEADAFGNGTASVYDSLCRPNGFIGGRPNTGTSDPAVVTCKSCLKKI